MVAILGATLEAQLPTQIGWSKLARRLKDLSAFLVTPLVRPSARFMIVMSIIVTGFRTCEVGPSAD
jgi:hypothetical protein